MPATRPTIDATTELCCAPLGSPRFQTASDPEQIAARLRALGDANRVRILQELACCEGHALTTTDLAGLLALSAATANHHLRQLEAAGLVTAHRDGARVLYRLEADHVRALAAVLTIGCAIDCC
ncbi:ArsR/SmtB family transcription factor [Demequina sp.]|uniref:ArsR/SmtB family transcription factor n=1 Tax=Demequina sp. TaxID=2050685 RepID=UPI003A88FAE4